MFRRRKYSRKFILLIVAPVFTFFISLLLSRFHPLLRIVSLFSVFLISGMGLAKFFKEVFKYDNQLDFIINSLGLGSFISVFFLLMLGMLGVHYTNIFLILFFGFLSIVSLGSMFFGEEEENLERVCGRKVKLLDILWILLFFLLFYLVIQICLEQYFPNWDSFTFWAIDSKYFLDINFVWNKNISFSRNIYTVFGPQLHTLISNKRKEDIKARFFEVTGCGGFLLTYDVEYLDRYFEKGKEIALYNESIEGIFSKIIYYLENEAEREKIALYGYEKTQSMHTYQDRFLFVFNKIGEKEEVFKNLSFS